MSIVQLVNIFEKYSLDALLLGIAVCLLTSLVKKLIPDKLKKFLTFIPFVFGILIYAAYLYFIMGKSEIFTTQTLAVGVRCGMAATIYYVLYEQFIRGKKKYADTSDPRELVVAGQIEPIILESYLKELPRQIVAGVEKSLADASYCVNYIVGAVRGKTRPAVSEDDLIAVGKLIVLTLSELEKRAANAAAR